MTQPLPVRPTNMLAVLALVLSFLVAVAGIVCGHLALAQIRRTGEAGRGLAIAGLVVGYVSVGVSVIAAIVFLVVVGLLAPRPGSVAPPVPVTPVPAPVAEQPASCDPAVVSLEPVVDANSYGPGELPQLSMAITNTGSTACTLDVGTAQQEYVISSGPDIVWSSRDCQAGGESLDLELEPGVPVRTSPFAWGRTRSDPSACADPGPEVPGGGSSYRLSVAVGGITSADDASFLLF